MTATAIKAGCAIENFVILTMGPMRATCVGHLEQEKSMVNGHKTAGRMPERSKEISGDENRGLTPIAAEQNLGREDRRERIDSRRPLKTADRSNS